MNLQNISKKNIFEYFPYIIVKYVDENHRKRIIFIHITILYRNVNYMKRPKCYLVNYLINKYDF